MLSWTNILWKAAFSSGHPVLKQTFCGIIVLQLGSFYLPGRRSSCNFLEEHYFSILARSLLGAQCSEFPSGLCPLYGTVILPQILFLSTGLISLFVHR